MLAELRNVSMKKRDIFSYFRAGGTTEAINSTVNEFIYCYQLITCSGHPKASKKSSGVLLCGGCMVAPLSSRPTFFTVVLTWRVVLIKSMFVVIMYTIVLFTLLCEIPHSFNIL